jgi:hypothetical protein
MRDSVRVVGAVLLGGLLGLGTVRLVPRCNDETITVSGDRVVIETHVVIENASAARRHYTLTLAEAPDAVLVATSTRIPVEPWGNARLPVRIDAPRDSFVGGERTFYIRIDDDRGSQRIVATSIEGPR